MIRMRQNWRGKVVSTGKMTIGRHQIESIIDVHTMPSALRASQYKLPLIEM